MVNETRTILYIRSSGIYNDSRATKEIQTICELNVNIIVLCWDRYGDAKAKNSALFSANPNINFEYYSKKVTTSGIGFRNLFKLMGWFCWVSKMIKQYKPDIIHFCDLDSSFFAVKQCVKKRIGYIYDIYDYYVDSHSIPRLLKKFVERREIYAINNSQCTIICTEERRAQISKANPNNIVVVHNSPSLKNITISADSATYDYVYCGSLGDLRLISEILDLYKDNSDLKFFFAGYGPLTKKCEELAKEFDNFVFAGSIPYPAVLNAEQQAMCLSAIYKPTIRNHQLCAPNKFYESLGLGKPIIVCKGTGIDSVVKDYDVGIVINYDASDFYSAVRSLKNDKNLPLKKEAALALFRERFSWDGIMANRIKELYKRLLKNFCI